MFNHSQQNLENLSQTVKKDLESSVKKLRRLKVKAALKTVITTIILIGGITTAVLIPNPISAAVSIGAATVLSGSEGIKHTLKRLKDVKNVKKLIKKTDKEADEQLFVNKVKSSVASEESPSAPPLAEFAYNSPTGVYPNLRV